MSVRIYNVSFFHWNAMWKQKGQKLFLAFFALFAFFASCPPSALRVDFLRISFTS
jgi:hypothetical protein